MPPFALQVGRLGHADADNVPAEAHSGRKHETSWRTTTFGQNGRRQRITTEITDLSVPYEKRCAAGLIPTSVLLGVQYAVGRHLIGLGALLCTFLFERLPGLLGHALSRRFVRHDTPLCSGAWVVPITRPYAYPGRRRNARGRAEASRALPGNAATWRRSENGPRLEVTRTLGGRAPLPRA